MKSNLPRNRFGPSFLMLLALSAGCTRHLKPVREFLGSSDRISAIAWSNDAKHVASGAIDGSVRVWKTDSMLPVAEADGYTPNGSPWMNGIAFSPDGATLAFGGPNGSIVLWNFDAGESKVLEGQIGSLRSLAFSPDGKLLATASGGLTYTQGRGNPPVVLPMVVVTFDTSSGRLLSRCAANGFLGVVFSPDATRFAGSRIAVNSSTTWPVAMGSPEMKNGAVQVRRTADGTFVSELEAPGWPTAFSPDGMRLLAGETISQVETGRTVRDLSNTGARVFLDGGATVLALVQGMGLPTEMLAQTRWIRTRYIDVETGRVTNTEKFVDDAKVELLLCVGQFSPDRRFIVDWKMRLCPVPR